MRELYDRHTPRLFSVIRQYSDDGALSEDLMQETWIRAFRGLRSFRGEGQFATWLYRIARNTAFKVSRSRRYRTFEEITDVEAHALPAPSIEKEWDLRMSLDSALAMLTPSMRTAVVMHDLEGYTHAEIGKRLRIAPVSSRTNLFRGRARLRDLLSMRPSTKGG